MESLGWANYWKLHDLHGRQGNQEPWRGPSSPHPCSWVRALPSVSTSSRNQITKACQPSILQVSLSWLTWGTVNRSTGSVLHTSSVGSKEHLEWGSAKLKTLLPWGARHRWAELTPLVPATQKWFPQPRSPCEMPEPAPTRSWEPTGKFSRILWAGC